ncbi:MAG: GNAT family N-acetyltransferase [Hyphomicrobiales bacterium]|nr:GNAT family N-acetyltransferase [Hyphomicrobiales bacterium]
MRVVPAVRKTQSSGALPHVKGAGEFTLSNSKSKTRSFNSLEISVHNKLDSLESAWRTLEKNSNITIYQRFEWISICLETIENEPNFQPLIVTAHENNKLVFILPLSFQNGWIKKIRWIGGSHSNYNLALIDNEFAGRVCHTDIRHIVGQISLMLHGFGYLKLCCQPSQWAGQENPLLALDHQPSTNNAFGIELSDGFENVLKKGNGKRKRKKFRWQTRILENLGGARLVQASNPAEVLEILSCFHSQKSSRLRNQGLKDVFGGKKEHLFLKKIALNSLDKDDPTLTLFALKIDGKYRAICGGGVLRNHFSAHFISFANDELAYISPGEMLVYMLVEKLTKANFKSMDLGGGEERFKQSWCSQTIEMVDIIIPLSRISAVYVWVFRQILTIRRLIRQNPFLWKTYKRLRIAATRFQSHFNNN